MRVSKHTVFFLLLTAVLLFGVSGGVFAQADEDFTPLYGRGDQMLSLSMGPFVPLFFAGGPDGVQETNLSLGGTGNLQWHAFMNSNITLGGELGGTFSFSPNRTLFMVPITARVAYFFRNYPWEFPVYLGAGVNFSRIPDEAFKADPILKPGFSVLWNLDSEWAFGTNFVYWWVPQIYLDAELEDETRFGNFLEITLTAVYRF